MNREEMQLVIKVVANAQDIIGITPSELKATSRLTSKLRKEYAHKFERDGSGRVPVVARRKPERLNSAYIGNLLQTHPRANWADLSRLAANDNLNYEGGAIRNHVRNVMGLNSPSKLRAFKNKKI